MECPGLIIQIREHYKYRVEITAIVTSSNGTVNAISYVAKVLDPPQSFWNPRMLIEDSCIDGLVKKTAALLEKSLQEQSEI